MDPPRPPRSRPGPNRTVRRRPSAADYRRRRLGVLGAAILLVVLIAYATSGGSSHHGGPSSSRRATTSSRPATSTTKPVPPHLEVSLAGWRLSAPLSRAVALPADGNIDLIGGLTGSGTSTTPAVTQYEPATGRAQPVGNLPVPVHDAAGAVIGARFFVFGGGAATLTSASQSFSRAPAPGAPSITVSGELPTPRADLSSASAPDGTVYLAGGFDGPRFSPAVLSTRDGITFTTVANLAVPVRYPAVAVAGGQLLVIGGETGSSPTPANEVGTDAIQAVDLHSGLVTIAGHLPVALAHASAATLDGSVYVFGGRSAGNVVDTVYKVSAGATGITAAVVGHLPLPTSDMAVVTLGQTAYLVGGEGQLGRPGTAVVIARMVSPSSPAAANPTGSTGSTVPGSTSVP